MTFEVAAGLASSCAGSTADRVGWVVTDRNHANSGQSSYLTHWLFRFPLEIEAMELNGALLNHPAGYQKLSLLRSKLLARRKRPVPKPVPQPRAGDIKTAVVQTLELSAVPMSLRDVHRACEELLGRKVPYSTVKDCVHKHSRGVGPRFKRVRHGLYEADPEATPYGLQVRRARHPGSGESGPG